MVPHVRLRPVPEGVQSVRSIRDRQEGLLGAVEDSAAGRFHQGHLGVGVGVDSGCCWGYSAVGWTQLPAALGQAVSHPRGKILREESVKTVK